MKIFDKIKNYFYDDLDEDDKKKVSTETTKSSDKFEVKNSRSNKTSGDDNSSISERELFKTDPTFNFPIVFDDEDFKEEKPVKKPIIPVREVFTKTTIQTVERKIFRPSPNISPIYGLIDDKKEIDKFSVNDNHGSAYNKSKKMNIDDVLGKVYTRTTEKIETYNTNEEPVMISSSEDLSYDFFENKNESPIKSRAELNKNSMDNTDVKLKTIDELLENTNEDDFYSLVDSMYKDTDEEGEL